MDKNSIIGVALIFLLFLVWQQVTAPTQEQIAEQKRIQDSIKTAQVRADSLANLTTIEQTTNVSNSNAVINNLPDSVKQLQLAGVYGPFAAVASGTEQTSTLENELLKVTFTNKGGRIKSVLLKKHFKIEDTEDGEEKQLPLEMLEDPKNKFEYFFPMANLPSGGVKTSDLYFTPSLEGNTIKFKATIGTGQYFEQVYALNADSYQIDYTINYPGLKNLIQADAEQLQLNWVNYLDKLERNTQYERNYSSAYFKTIEDHPDYCSCTSDDVEQVSERIQWVSHTNQFFNSTLMANAPFQSAKLETQVLPEEDKDLKKLLTTIQIPFRETGDSYAMKWYVGPNDFKTLKSYNSDLEYIIPFGSSIFGTVNRWIIRPIFTFLSQYINSKGIVILLLTLIVKLFLFPLTYKMLHSQSKMAALKPKMEKLKAKHKDPQKVQMETMKMYQEFGVNPLGGCLPMVAQMPIWFALYRFFPASIEFRQASFLWATDLSSYDVFARLPFEIPFYGEHVSMFTLLWAATTLIYTWYNMKHIDMSAAANPAMQYMQYFMPLMFLFFFNNFAAGLTCYLLFSNLINITQTVVTKNFIINKDKLLAELEENKKKPKKQSAFRKRLEDAMKEQQRVQAEQAKKKKK